jgi:Glycosyltransferase family 87
MVLKNKWVLLNLLILAGILAHSIRRDILLDKQYPADLRNRVVGARLQKDGKLPYFFHDKPSDFPRYTDPVSNPDTTIVSNITASPFFHQLLMPICDIPQRTFSRLWLCLEYLMLFSMIWMVSRFASGLNQKLLLLNTGILFTLTEAWIRHIASGQLYLSVGFLFCIIFCCLLTNKKRMLIWSGLLATALVLIRPSALVFFIPFVFQYRKYFAFLFSSFVFLSLYVLLVSVQPFQKSLWVQYQQAIEKHIEIHQGGDKRGLFLTAHNYIPYLEGFNREDIFRNIREHPILGDFVETGSFFVIFQNITHQKLPLKWLNALSFLNLLFFSLLFFLYGRKSPPAVSQIFILGFLLYMLVEIWNPVTRYQYNVVQWLPVLLAGMLYLSKMERPYRHPAFLLLIAGLFLTITNFRWIPDRNTIGEVAWFFGLLMISFNFKKTLNFESSGITK